MAAVTRTERFWRNAAVALSIVAVISALVVGTDAYKRGQIEKKPAAALSGKFMAISARSKNELVTFMKKEPLVVAVSAVSVSLITNRRQDTFFESKIPEFQATWENFMAMRDNVPEVFSQQKKFNTRITSIINGNFECRPTKDTLIATLYPVNEHAAVVCSIAVPPGFDASADFVGYVNFFLKEQPSDSERARLAKEAVVLSSTIYHRDISPDNMK